MAHGVQVRMGAGIEQLVGRPAFGRLEHLRLWDHGLGFGSLGFRSLAFVARHLRLSHPSTSRNRKPLVP